MSKPVVDRLEQELEGQAQVLRLNVSSSVNVNLAMRYGVRGVPTFLLLDGAGNVVWGQAGAPNKGKIIAAVNELTGP